MEVLRFHSVAFYSVYLLCCTNDCSLCPCRPKKLVWIIISYPANISKKPGCHLVSELNKNSFESWNKDDKKLKYTWKEEYALNHSFSDLIYKQLSTTLSPQTVKLLLLADSKIL